MNNEIAYEIKRFIGVIGEPTANGWIRELNIVSWNEGMDKYDIRSWNPDHTMMTRGITLTKEQFNDLVKLGMMELGEVNHD